MNEKLDGSIIENAFLKLADVGETLGYINELSVAFESSNHPKAFADAVHGMLIEKLDWFNEAMVELTETFEGLEFEPISIE